MRRHRLRRGLITSGLVLLVIVAAAAVLAGWAVSTEKGARWSFERLGAALPGHLKVGRIDGSIRGPLAVSDLHYETKTAHLTIDRVRLDWDLDRLFHQELDIHQLTAAGASLVLAAPESTAVPESTVTNPAIPDINLPLNILLREAALHDLRITTVGADSAVVIDSVLFRQVAFGDTLSIRALEFRSRALDVDLAGRAWARKTHALDLETRWRAAFGRMEPMHGSGRFGGSLDSLVIAQQVTAPFAAAVSGTVMHPMSLRFMDLAITFKGLRPSAFDPSLPAYESSGAAHLTGRPDTLASKGSVVALINGREAHADFQLERYGSRIEVREIAVEPPAVQGRVVARGTLVLAKPSMTFDLAGDWDRLTLIAAAAPAARPASRGARPRGPSSPEARDGAFTIAGTPDAYRFTASTRVAGGAIPPGRVAVRGRGTTRSAAFDRIDASLLRGTIRGRGEVAWSPALRWSGHLVADHLDPAAFHPDYPGSLGFTIDGRGKDVALSNLHGALRGQPVSGGARATVVTGGADVDTLDVLWGPNRLRASGLVAGRYDLDATLLAPDLSVALPRGGGAFTLAAHLDGTRAEPALRAEWSGDSLRWDRVLVDSLGGAANLSLAPAAPLDLHVFARDAFLGGRSVSRLDLTARGRRESHDIVLDADAGEDTLALRLAGGWGAGEWRGAVDHLAVRAGRFGAWATAAPAPLVAGRNGGELRDFTLASGESRLAVSGAWHTASGWRADLALEELQLTLLEAFAPGLHLSGPVNGTVSARSSGAGAVPFVNAALTVGPGIIAYPGERGLDRVHLAPGTITVVQDAGGLRGEVDLRIEEAGTLRASARVPPGAGSARPLDGTVKVAFNDLAFVRGLVPGTGRTSGAFDADLALRGTLARPAWSGEARLVNASTHVPSAGIEVHDVNLRATSDPAGRLAVKGSLRSGPGAVDVDGTATLAPGAVPRADVSLKGDRFQALARSDMTALVSPDIHVSMVRDTLRVTGELRVPEASIKGTPRNEDEIPVETSPDVVFGAADTTVKVSGPTRVFADVRLTLGDRVKIDARGLKAKATGSLLMVERPGVPTTGSGELRITDGQYRAYGQDFTIERGRLIFGGGPLSNPGLDIRASRQAADDVTAGFEVTGSLAAPELGVFADPPMAERDALAYALLGHRLEGSDPGQASLLDRAAARLEAGGGSLLASKLGQELGLEEASLETSSDSLHTSTLMLGAYLSPSLFVRYGATILNPLASLQIRYFLSRKWTLEAASGTETSAGVMYTGEQ